MNTLAKFGVSIMSFISILLFVYVSINILYSSTINVLVVDNMLHESLPNVIQFSLFVLQVLTKWILYDWDKLVCIIEWAKFIKTTIIIFSIT